MDQATQTLPPSLPFTFRLAWPRRERSPDSEPSASAAQQAQGGAAPSPTGSSPQRKRPSPTVAFGQLMGGEQDSNKKFASNALVRGLLGLSISASPASDALPGQRTMARYEPALPMDLPRLFEPLPSIDKDRPRLPKLVFSALDSPLSSATCTASPVSTLTGMSPTSTLLPLKFEPFRFEPLNEPEFEIAVPRAASEDTLCCQHETAERGAVCWSCWTGQDVIEEGMVEREEILALTSYVEPAGVVGLESVEEEEMQVEVQPRGELQPPAPASIPEPNIVSIPPPTTTSAPFEALETINNIPIFAKDVVVARSSSFSGTCTSRHQRTNKSKTPRSILRTSSAPIASGLEEVQIDAPAEDVVATDRERRKPARTVSFAASVEYFAAHPGEIWRD